MFISDPGLLALMDGTDKEEFYQMMEYKNDVDLEQKIREWENFYNYHRPHGV